MRPGPNTRPLAALVLAVGLSGCLGSAPPVPADHYYRFLVSEPAGAPARRAFPGVISVTAFAGDGLLRSRPILFAAGEDPHQIRQHNYHYWADPPTRLVQGEMVAYLRRAGLADAVVTPDMQINADYELQGRVKRLERLLGDGRARIAVEIELAVIRLRDRKLMMSKSYTADRDSGDDSVNASVLAMSQALGGIFEDFRRDATRTLEAALR